MGLSICFGYFFVCVIYICLDMLCSLLKIVLVEHACLFNIKNKLIQCWLSYLLLICVGHVTNASLKRMTWILPIILWCSIYYPFQAITSTGIKKGEAFLADVSSQLKNKNITTDVKVDTNSNVSCKGSLITCVCFVVFDCSYLFVLISYILWACLLLLETSNHTLTHPLLVLTVLGW